MDLVEAPGRFSIRLKERIRVVRIAEDVSSRAITGNKRVFTLVEFFSQFGVKGVEKICEGSFV